MQPPSWPTLCGLIGAAQFIYAKSTSSLSPATEVQFTNGQVVIPAGGLAKDDLNRFQVNVNGTEVRFFLYRKPDNSVAALFDTCEICGPAGFMKSPNGGLVCKNCAAPINPQSVGQEGGCNPIPLRATFADDKVMISQADLEKGASYFRER